MKVLVLLWFFELEVSEVLLCERHLTNITNSQKWRRRGTYCIFSKRPKKYMKIKYKWLWALLVVFQFEIGLGLQALFQQGPGLKLFFGKGQVFGQKKFLHIRNWDSVWVKNILFRSTSGPWYYIFPPITCKAKFWVNGLNKVQTWSNPNLRCINNFTLHFARG